MNEKKVITMSSLASIKDLENKLPQAAQPKSSALARLNPLSTANIERRRSRENGSGLMTAQTPISDADMRPFMAQYQKTADQVIETINQNLQFISSEFGGGLYALTSKAVEESVERIAHTVTNMQRTRELVEAMSRNLDAHRIFASEMSKIRLAAKNKDINVLIDALLKFAKFFDANLWSTYNKITEIVYDKTGFAVGEFTRDFHLQWMQLLQIEFVQNIMRAVGEAAKSLQSYVAMRDILAEKRIEIEDKIDENKALESIWAEGEALYREYQDAMQMIDRLEQKLRESQANTFTGETISETELKEAVALANRLDQKIKEVEIRYNTAAETTLAASRTAQQARLPLHALALHVQSVAAFVIYSGEFVQNTATHFAVYKLLNITRDAKMLKHQGLKAAAMPHVGEAVKRLNKEQNYTIDIPRDGSDTLDVRHANTGMQHKIPVNGGVVYDAAGRPVITSTEVSEDEKSYQHLKLDNI